jgi:excisionase family DNA binding protein
VTELLERLRQMAQSVPPGGSVVVPRDWLDAELQALEPTSVVPDDLTVEQAAKHLHRSESTIRDWVESGRLPGAYKRGRVWRVPRTALNNGIPTGRVDNGLARLGAWRAVRRLRG